MMQSLDVLATCALEHYKTLPNHGKPREGQEWTVYAALLVSPSTSSTTENDNDIQPYVVCSATGSKCTTTGPDGWCLRDLHAEVLVKRGLQRLLWKEILTGEFTLLYKLPSDQITDQDELYAVKEHLQLHLYISDSPCGDATIYELGNGCLKFTGAKLIVGRAEGNSGLACCNNLTTVVREDVQQLGQLRIKSGRSNLPNHLRSSSLSCSDKILKWTLLGLQGSRLPVRPVFLTSVILSLDPQANSMDSQQHAAQRAILDRRNSVIRELKKNENFRSEQHDFLKRLEGHELTIRVLDIVFDGAKSQFVLPLASESSLSSDVRNRNGKRPIISCLNDDFLKHTRKVKISPSGFCMNWQQHDGVEVLVGGRGSKHGKKCVTEADYMKWASRLCQKELNALAIAAMISERPSVRQKCTVSRDQRKKSVLCTTPLQGWIRKI